MAIQTITTAREAIANERETIATEEKTIVKGEGKLNFDLQPFASNAGSSKAGKMIGADGVRVTSKTLWKEKGSRARIDVENPNPGQRPGQIHYQDQNGNKYLFDIDKGVFVDKNGNIAPKSVNDNLKNPEFVKN